MLGVEDGIVSDQKRTAVSPYKIKFGEIQSWGGCSSGGRAGGHMLKYP